MNQAELIGKVLAADRQAQAIAKDAKDAEANLDQNIEEEIKVLEATYRNEAQEKLRALEASEKEKCQAQMKLLDAKLHAKLHQVDDLYESKKDLWVDTIVTRIVGKAGG